MKPGGREIGGLGATRWPESHRFSHSEAYLAEAPGC